MSVAIYMEGGGEGPNGRAALRRGMDGLLGPLKKLARRRAIRWKLTCCGPRNEAFRRFQDAVESGEDAVVVLLVDAEEPVAGTPRNHLQNRDGWRLGFATDDNVHLMVQTMESWIVADPDALRKYYGQGFNARALPTTQNLEEVAKRDIDRALRQATERTQKREYHKIRHASDLLQRIDAEVVMAKCRHCRRLFDELGQMIIRPERATTRER